MNHTPIQFKLPLTLLILIQFVIGHQAIGRPDTPCNCLGFTTIGADDTNTNITSVSGGISSNTCYLIRGRLIINDGTTWDEVRLKMAEGSEIRVISDLTILDSYISGCDKMWKGIITTSLTNLSVSGSVIEAAEFGIRLASFTSFQCEYNEFINDFIGIANGSPFEADQFGHVTLQRGSIKGCKFYTNTVVPGPYPGHIEYEEWPESPVEIPYDQGYAAIFLTGSIGFDVGYIHAEGADRNEVYQMRNGIILRNSVLNISGTDFYDFEGGIPKVPVDPVLGLNQQAINGYRSWAYVIDNTFAHIMVGIHTQESWMYIYDNLIQIPVGIGQISATRGISAYLSQQHTITDNIIDNGFKGILLNTPVNPFLIENNILDRNLGTKRHTGIEVLYGRSWEELGQIRENDIMIDDGNYATGIHLNAATNLRVVDNDIFFYDVYEAGKFNAGISLSEGGPSVLNLNDIDASASYATDPTAFNSGFLVKSQFNRFALNDMDHMNTLFKVVGPNPLTDLECNNFYFGPNGLELVSPAMIGTQEHHGNEWLSEDDYDFGAYISGPDPIGTAEMSRFDADESDEDPGVLIPFDIGPGSVENNWFKDEDGEDLCPEPIPDEDLDEDTLVMLVRSELDFTHFNDQMTWMVKADLFELLLNVPSLLSNEVLDSFFTVEENTVLGDLIQFQQDLGSRFDVEVELKDAEEDTIGALLKDLIYIDSMLFTQPIDYIDWVDLRELKADSLADNMGTWLDLVEDEEVASVDVYENVLEDLGELTPTNDLEDYLIEALQLRAAYLLDGGLSSEDSVDVVNLLELCPWEGGRAVSIANVLYPLIADSTMSSVIYECSEPEPHQINPNHGVAYTEVGISVYPNPAHDQTMISAEDAIRKIYVTGAGRQLQLTFIPNRKTFSIDVSRWQNGMYFLTIITDKGTSTQKLTLVK